LMALLGSRVARIVEHVGTLSERAHQFLGARCGLGYFNC
jgi:hypothetical protein